MKKAIPKITEKLWNNDVLNCEASLVQAYSDELKTRGLYEAACGSHKNATGGENKQATEENFTHRYLSSVVRTEYLTLDPKNNFKKVQDFLLANFASGELAILDIPGGCSGGIMGIVSTIIELRRSSLLPMLPLNLKIITGDISPTANDIFEKMFERLKSDLLEVGIRYELKSEIWDVMDLDSSSRVVDSLFNQASDNSMHLIFISAFSSYLRKSANMTTFKKALTNIKSRFYQKHVCYLHIETNEKIAKGIMEKIIDFFKEGTNIWQKVLSILERKDFNWQHPLKSNSQSIRGHLSVVLFEKKYKR